MLTEANCFFFCLIDLNSAFVCAFFFLILSVTVALLLPMPMPMPVCVSVFRTLWIRLFVMLIDIKVYSFSDVSNDVRCVTHNCTEYREYKVKDSQNSWNCRASFLFRYHSRSLCFFFFSCISVCVFEDEVLKKKMITNKQISTCCRIFVFVQ